MGCLELQHRTREFNSGLTIIIAVGGAPAHPLGPPVLADRPAHRNRRRPPLGEGDGDSDGQGSKTQLLLGRNRPIHGIPDGARVKLSDPPRSLEQVGRSRISA